MRTIFSFLIFFSLFSCSRSVKKNDDQGEVTKIPLFFLSCSDAPLLQIELEGLFYNLKLDSGANCTIGLQDKVLSRLEHKTYVDTTSFSDVKGNQYTEENYLIPFFELSSLNITGAIAGKESLGFTKKGSKIGQWWNKKQIQNQLDWIDGRIGTEILQAMRQCYFDVAHHCLYVADSLEKMQKFYDHKAFLQIPFELTKGIVTLSAKTDSGTKRLFLDTGASASLLNEPDASANKWTKSQLSLGDFDFGPWDFYLYEFHFPVEIDGNLGIDFFKKYKIHLDFEHSMAYIIE